MKVKELIKCKQGPHETFSDYVSDMQNLHFKLKHKIAEDEFVELLKDKRADFYRKHPSKKESCPIKFHDATCWFCEKIGTDAYAYPAAFARSSYGKTGIAGWTRNNPFR